ncbi:MAG: GtrA family protein [Methylovirgula sp.]
MPALRFIKTRFAGEDAVQFVTDLLTDLWRYGLCSALALALDWGLLMELVGAGMNYLPAAATSFFAGMVLAYLGSIVFVYRGRRAYPVLAEAIGFFLIGLAGLIVNVLLLFAFVKLVGLGVGLAKAPTAAGVFLFNFLMRRTLLFASAPAVAGLPDEAPSPVARY